MTNNKELIQKVEEFVKVEMSQYGGDHDWTHIDRVRNYALEIAGKVAKPIDLEIIELAALLHDVADYKLATHGLSDRQMIEKVLGKNYDQNKLEGIIEIVGNLSWSKGVKDISNTWNNEFHIVQDADRIDALGAIGVARTFAYGGFKKRPLYIESSDMVNVDVPASLNHLHWKILKIKDSLHYAESKVIAGPLHDYVQQFSDQFLKEWNR
jgi:uncharacterized protein